MKAEDLPKITLQTFQFVDESGNLQNYIRKVVAGSTISSEMVSTDNKEVVQRWYEEIQEIEKIKKELQE